MATAINDLSAAVTCQLGVGPAAHTASTAGGAIDLIAGDGAGFAVLAVGALAPDTEVGGYLQESADGETWDDGPIAAFPDVTEAYTARAVNFRRSARYVRAVLTLDGPSPEANAAILIGQPVKSR